MAFKAELDIAGVKKNILELSYALKQETDATGRPSSITRGGQIHITVESTDSETFIEWATDPFGRKDGEITFTKRDSDATLKTLSFKEGYCTKYEERFSSTGENPIVEIFTISAKEIAVGNSVHNNNWAV